MNRFYSHWPQTLRKEYLQQYKIIPVAFCYAGSNLQNDSSA
jgi:hypothetical protein